jgi:hypothetical protein
MSKVCGSMQAGVMERFMKGKDEYHTCTHGRGAKEGGEDTTLFPILDHVVCY